MIRQQFPFLEESKLLLQSVHDLGRALTPVDQVPIMIDLPEDESSALKLELRASNIALAKVGSPGAYHAVMSELSQIIANFT